MQRNKFDPWMRVPSITFVFILDNNFPPSPWQPSINQMEGVIRQNSAIYLGLDRFPFSWVLFPLRNLSHFLSPPSIMTRLSSPSSLDIDIAGDEARGGTLRYEMQAEVEKWMSDRPFKDIQP